MVAHSLRTRLLLWNTAVIVLLLVGFAAAMTGVTRARLTSMIDRDLRHRGDEAVQLGPPPPEQQRMFRLDGGVPGPGPEPGAPGPPPGQRPRPRTPGLGPIPQVYQDASRLADIRRPRFVAAGSGSDPAWSDKSFEGATALVTAPTFTDLGRLRVLSMPAFRNGVQIGTVQVAQETDLLLSLSQAQTATFAVLLPVALVFVVLGARVLIDRALRPVDRLTRAAAAISAEDLSQRLPVTGDDELARIAGTFNDLLGRLDTAFAEEKSAYSRLQEAYDAQQRFTADASHELRTPLTRIRLTLGNALNAPGNLSELQRAAERADATAAEMARLVEDLLTLARTDAGVLTIDARTVDLRVPVSEGIEAVAGPGPVPTACFPDEPVPVQGDEALLSRVVVNLVGNARRHTPQDGTVHVTVDSEGGWARVTVQDTGDGIPEEDIPHVFDRFYRAGEARSRRDGGTGLGLAITKGLVEAHKGRVDIASQEGQGTVVRVLLPLVSDPHKSLIGAS
ncbi:MAG: HAMP domain-containing histidine kinase [Fimbriimonadaceae bacterium]|nr:HAMP domain-containing histidine kinase [Fimbriimonadaceae bacterium]